MVKASTDNEQFFDANGNKMMGILPYVVDLNGFSKLLTGLPEIDIKQSDGTYKFPSRYERKISQFAIYDTDEYNYIVIANTVKAGFVTGTKTSLKMMLWTVCILKISCADTRV